MKDKVRMQFLGATGYVTGSRTLLETEKTRIYVDAGLYQGPKFVEEKNYQPLETSQNKIDAVFLTHAHIDHSGLLPLLVKKGFEGPVYCTPSTRDLLEILLPDAGRIQEEEFRFLSKKKVSQYHLDGPLFTEEDAMKTLALIKTVPFGETFSHGDFEGRFYYAGHILGAGYLQLKALGKTILFSGDLGPRQHILHNNRVDPPVSDYVVMESTYGNRKYEKQNYQLKMQKAIEWVISKKGMLIIPSFAVGRTQLVLYVLYHLQKTKRIPEIPIFIDSPMATKATRIYLKYPEEMKPEIIQEGFLDFVESNKIRLIEEVADSKRLNYFNGPGILISASGMCHGGRIMHHLYNRLWDRRNMVLFVGYQAEGTLGRQILEGAGRVKVFDREVPVRTNIDTINSFSAHADRKGLEAWAKQCASFKPEILFLNHGEDDSRQELHKKISSFYKGRIELPKSEAIYYL